MTSRGHYHANPQNPAAVRETLKSAARREFNRTGTGLLLKGQRASTKEKYKMKTFKAATTVCCMALMGLAVAQRVQADDLNKKTVVKFSGPVEIPGVHLKGWGILPAGTYVFKLVDSKSDRHIVQIFSADEKTVYATILAIPNYRLKATEKTVITFRERPAGQPEALRAWFYPGRTSGEEFVYPKAKAIEIAQSTKTPVLFTPAEIPLEVTEPIQPADEPIIAQLRQAPVMAVQPSGEPVELAQVVAPPPPAEMVHSLPATAGSLPLITLFGLLALGGVFALRAAEKRIL
jgi:hypothetical protein